MQSSKLRFVSQAWWSNSPNVHQRPVVGQDLKSRLDHLVETGQALAIDCHLFQLLAATSDALRLIPVKTRKEQTLKLGQPLRPERNTLNADVVFSAEFDQVKSAKRRHYLVLTADMLLENVALDMNGFIGQLLGPEKFAFETVQGCRSDTVKVEEEPKPVKAGEIRDVVQFDVFLQAAKSQAFAKDPGVQFRPRTWPVRPFGKRPESSSRTGG